MNKTGMPKLRGKVRSNTPSWRDISAAVSFAKLPNFLMRSGGESVRRADNT